MWGNTMFTHEKHYTAIYATEHCKQHTAQPRAAAIRVYTTHKIQEDKNNLSHTLHQATLNTVENAALPSYLELHDISLLDLFHDGILHRRVRSWL
jgi:hypothetical protein